MVVQSEREIRGKGRRPHRSCHFALRNARTRGFHRPPSLGRISTSFSLFASARILSLHCAQILQSFAKQPMASFLILRSPPNSFQFSPTILFIRYGSCFARYWRIVLIFFSTRSAHCSILRLIIHCPLYCEILERMNFSLQDGCLIVRLIRHIVKTSR